VIRPVWLRALTALWGIWFATALTEPAGLLACPMHSGQTAMASGAVTHDNSAPAAHASMAGDARAGHGSTPTVAGNSAPAPADHHSCTCLGQCCSMAIDALSEGADVLLPMQASRIIRTPRPTAVAHIATPVEHSRPFAIGPPALIG
jgi:hypothetical protein